MLGLCARLCRLAGAANRCRAALSACLQVAAHHGLCVSVQFHHVQLRHHQGLLRQLGLLPAVPGSVLLDTGGCAAAGDALQRGRVPEVQISGEVVFSEWFGGGCLDQAVLYLTQATVQLLVMHYKGVVYQRYRSQLRVSRTKVGLHGIDCSAADMHFIGDMDHQPYHFQVPTRLDGLVLASGATEKT